MANQIHSDLESIVQKYATASNDGACVASIICVIQGALIMGVLPELSEQCIEFAKYQSSVLQEAMHKLDGVR